MSLDASDNSMIRTVRWYWIISRGALPFGCTKRLSSPGPISTWPFSSLSSQHPSTCSRCDVFIPSRQIVSPLLKWRWQGLACQDYNFLFRRFALFVSMWDHWRIKGTMKVALDEEPEPLMWRQPVCELTPPASGSWGDTPQRLPGKWGHSFHTYHQDVSLCRHLAFSSPVFWGNDTVPWASVLKDKSLCVGAWKRMQKTLSQELRSPCVFKTTAENGHL